MKHGLWMLIGCALPVLLIFLLPAFGVGKSGTVFVFVVLMFLCHLMMFSGHGRHQEHEGAETKKEH